MGADSWSEITTWREWERLLTMTNHIVVTRPGYEASKAHAGAHADRVFFTDVVMNDVSATNIRQLASEGRHEDLIDLLPGPVLAYIRKYGIYRELNEAKLNS
jgi:nicotinate-nucleotide adenylyltransferase